MLDNIVEAVEEKLSLIDNKLDNSVHASEESKRMVENLS